MTLTLSMAETLDALIDNNPQETDYSSYAHHPEQEEDNNNNNNNIDLSLLRINSFGNSSDRRRRANSSPPRGSFVSSPAAATSPVKRPSPESKEADEPMGYSKIPLPVDCNPSTRVRSSPIYKRSLSDTFASRRSRVAQETALPPRPPVFRRCVSDLSPGRPQAFRGPSSRETDLAVEETSEANKVYNFC